MSCFEVADNRFRSWKWAMEQRTEWSVVAQKLYIGEETGDRYKVLSAGAERGTRLGIEAAVVSACDRAAERSALSASLESPARRQLIP